MKSRHLFAAMTVFVVAVFGYAITTPHPGNSAGSAGPDQPSVAASVSASATGPPAAYDIAHLLAPPRDYLGVALSGVPQDMSRVDKWTTQVGTKPNMITIYESFDDAFAVAEIRKVYQYGALPIVRWEPLRVTLGEIAAGGQDAYITEFATAVRRLNLPIALTFAHEMNGNWYPWGTQRTKPADFVAAWQHLHDLFVKADATNVIWTWTPNVVNGVPKVKLAPYYPGDAYVNWIGVDGYFTHDTGVTYQGLFGATMSQIRGFTTLPFLIVETGSEPGSMRARALDDLFTSVAKAKDVIGFIYFNQKGSRDWTIDSDQAAIATYKSRSPALQFGFAVS
jgi:hypothetical protein